MLHISLQASAARSARPRVAQFVADGHVEPHAARLAKLFQGPNRQPSILDGRDVHGNAVGTVAGQQVHGRPQGRELSALASLLAL